MRPFLGSSPPRGNFESMNTVDLEGVVVLLGQFPALAGLDLVVAPGEAVLLQGPNGAGKSTLLRLCAGLQRVERGRAFVLGMDLLGDRRPVRSRVGLVGQQSMLYEDLTVLENSRFWGRAIGASEREQSAALERMCIDSRLHDVAIRHLSTGQKRRVSLAITIARRPQLWLLDEPHAGLDQLGRDLVDGLIEDAKSAGGSVLVASHELERVRPVVDRQMTLSGGMINNDVGGVVGAR